MSQRFNPYQAWFGLDPSTKPSYYALLGLRDFETEPPVIAEAAELRLQLLEPHKQGEHADQAEKLGREVTGVMNVLLSPDKRRQYDEKLRGQNGRGAAATRPAPSADAMLPPSIGAADSPTSILPPGSIPPPGAPFAQPGMPTGLPPYAAPSTPMGYADPAYAQAPAMAFPTAGGMPPQAAGMPGYPTAAAPYAPQYGAAPPYAAPPAAAGYPTANGSPYAAAPQAPYGMPEPAAPNFGAAPHAAPAASNAPFTSSNVSQRTRLAGIRKQKSSPVMMALGLLGAGAAVLAIVMLAFSAMNKSKPAQVASAGTPAAPKVVPPNEMTSEKLMAIQAEQARRNTQAAYADNSVSQRLGGGPVYRSASDAELRNESMMANQQPGGQMPSNDDLVMMMAPKGAVPSVATPKSPPSFDMPAPATTPPTAMPAATAMAAAPDPAMGMPATTPGTPVIGGLEPSKMEMTAVLPADEARARSVNTMLGAARKFMQKRDYAKAEEIILQAQVLADAPEVITTAHAHGRALELLQAFWLAAREGVKTLKEGDEVTFDGKTMKVVKHDEVSLVVKGTDNREVVLAIDKLLPGLAVQMAERTLSTDDRTMKLSSAVFWGLDQAGDRAKAAAILDEAAGAGTDVADVKSVVDLGA